ncbi:hypothetical protein DFS34DRAFT_598870 [Phlyctochytrium arcticum]|nr:hypothetical protein DFS34DRAFT_598870 [Phlyctochytrium arcticum]
MMPDEDEDVGTEDDIVEDDEEIRCICGFEDDDGNTIACDKCGVWQHMICVDVDPHNVPEIYLCERCAPRPLDVERAIDFQKKRRERRGKAKNKHLARKNSQEKISPNKKKKEHGEPQQTEGINGKAVEREGRGIRYRARGKQSKEHATAGVVHQDMRKKRKNRERSSILKDKGEATHSPIDDVPKPVNDYESEYHTHAAVFGELTYSRFANAGLSSKVTKLLNSWRESNKSTLTADCSGLSNAYHLDSFIPLSVNWLLDHISGAIWDPLPPDPITGVRQFGLFATLDIEPHSYVTDIKGSLSQREFMQRQKGLGIFEKDQIVLPPPFVFPHSAKELCSVDGFPFVVDARDWGERGGRYIRFYCGANGDAEERCNAELRSIVVYDEEELDEATTYLTVNERLMLGIFTTRHVYPHEEILLGGGQSDWLAYPCICKNARGCLVKQALRARARGIRSESDIAKADANVGRSGRGSKRNSVAKIDTSMLDDSLGAVEGDNSTEQHSGKPLSREEKKLQDQLARIERMEREAQLKRARQEKRARTKSGTYTHDADADSFEPISAKTSNANKRRRDREDEESPAVNESNEDLDSPVSKKARTAEVTPTQTPRHGGFKAWIFAQKEVKEAMARHDTQREGAPTRPEQGDSLGHTSEPYQATSESPPPLREDAANRQASSETVNDETKKSKSNAVDATTSSCSSDGAVKESSTKLPPIRKVSLQEFMAKKRAAAASAPNVPSINESGELSTPGVKSGFSFLKKHQSETSISGDKPRSIELNDGFLQQPQRTSTSILHSDSKTVGGRSDGQFPKFPTTSGLASIFGVGNTPTPYSPERQARRQSLTKPSRESGNDANERDGGIHQAEDSHHQKFLQSPSRPTPYSNFQSPTRGRSPPPQTRNQGSASAEGYQPGQYSNYRAPNSAPQLFPSGAFDKADVSLLGRDAPPFTERPEHIPHMHMDRPPPSPSPAHNHPSHVGSARVPLHQHPYRRGPPPRFGYGPRDPRDPRDFPERQAPPPSAPGTPRDPPPGGGTYDGQERLGWDQNRPREGDWGRKPTGRDWDPRDREVRGTGQPHWDRDSETGRGRPREDFSRRLSTTSSDYDRRLGVAFQGNAPRDPALAGLAGPSPPERHRPGSHHQHFSSGTSLMQTPSRPTPSPTRGRSPHSQIRNQGTASAEGYQPGQYSNYRAPSSTPQHEPTVGLEKADVSLGRDAPSSIERPEHTAHLPRDRPPPSPAHDDSSQVGGARVPPHQHPYRHGPPPRFGYGPRDLRDQRDFFEKQAQPQNAPGAPRGPPPGVGNYDHGQERSGWDLNRPRDTDWDKKPTKREWDPRDSRQPRGGDWDREEWDRERAREDATAGVRPRDDNLRRLSSASDYDRKRGEHFQGDLLRSPAMSGTAGPIPPERRRSVAKPGSAFSGGRSSEWAEDTFRSGPSRETSLSPHPSRTDAPPPVDDSRRRAGGWISPRSGPPDHPPNAHVKMEQSHRRSSTSRPTSRERPPSRNLAIDHHEGGFGRNRRGGDMVEPEQGSRHRTGSWDRIRWQPASETGRWGEDGGPASTPIKAETTRSRSGSPRSRMSPKGPRSASVSSDKQRPGGGPSRRSDRPSLRIEPYPGRSRGASPAGSVSYSRNSASTPRSARTSGSGGSREESVDREGRGGHEMGSGHRPPFRPRDRSRNVGGGGGVDGSGSGGLDDDRKTDTRERDSGAPGRRRDGPPSSTRRGPPDFDRPLFESGWGNTSHRSQQSSHHANPSAEGPSSRGDHFSNDRHRGVRDREPGRDHDREWRDRPGGGGGGASTGQWERDRDRDRRDRGGSSHQDMEGGFSRSSSSGSHVGPAGSNNNNSNGPASNANAVGSSSSTLGQQEYWERQGRSYRPAYLRRD